MKSVGKQRRALLHDHGSINSAVKTAMIDNPLNWLGQGAFVVSILDDA